jgi:acyl phosphate:glycerol-3-phosphate acyltransferase
VDVFNIVWRTAIVVAFAYFLAGVPFGVIVARRVYDVDITQHGSGNTGATNVFRTFGWRAALPVALLDVAKGVVPALLARFVLADPAWAASGRDLLVIAAGVAAMAGHMFSPYFRLRGGKGVATAAGAILVLMPRAFFVLLVIFVLLIVLFRIVSLASMLAALALPLITWALYPARPVLFAFACVAVPLILFSHRANIGRLVRREEPRITMGRASDHRREERS